MPVTKITFLDERVNTVAVYDVATGGVVFPEQSEFHTRAEWEEFVRMVRCLVAAHPPKEVDQCVFHFTPSSWVTSPVAAGTEPRAPSGEMELTPPGPGTPPAQ